MRSPGPFCGDRDAQEFVHRGDATPQRPADANGQAMFDYLYLRENPAGPIREHWYHAQGCRNWLVVERDTRTHRIGDVQLASEGRR